MNPERQQNGVILLIGILIDHQECFQLTVRFKQNMMIQSLLAQLKTTYHHFINGKKIYKDKQCNNQIQKKAFLQKGQKYFLNFSAEDYESIIKKIFFVDKKVPAIIQPEIAQQKQQDIIVKKENKIEQQNCKPNQLNSKVEQNSKVDEPKIKIATPRNKNVQKEEQTFAMKLKFPQFSTPIDYNKSFISTNQTSNQAIKNQQPPKKKVQSFEGVQTVVQPSSNCCCLI